MRADEESSLPENPEPDENPPESPNSAFPEIPGREDSSPGSSESPTPPDIASIIDTESSDSKPPAPETPSLSSREETPEKSPAESPRPTPPSKPDESSKKAERKSAKQSEVDSVPAKRRGNRVIPRFSARISKNPVIEMDPARWAAIASYLLVQSAIQAGAVGLGFGQKIEKTRAPSIFIIHRILKKHRGKSSWIFLIRWGWWNAPNETAADVLPEKLLRKFGLIHRDIRWITGLYWGLKEDVSQATAVTACVEIIRNLHANDKGRK